MIRCSACEEAPPTAALHGYTHHGDLVYCDRTGQAAIGEKVPDDPRIDRAELYMHAALLFARRSTCLRAHVGAVAVRDRRILVTAYNGAPPGAAHCLEVGCLPGADSGCVRTVHAEANAIAWSAREGISLKDAELYCTHEPCLACAKLIVTAGISKVSFLNPYRLHDGIELLDQLFIPVIKMELFSDET